MCSSTSPAPTAPASQHLQQRDSHRSEHLHDQRARALASEPTASPATTITVTNSGHGLRADIRFISSSPPAARQRRLHRALRAEQFRVHRDRSRFRAPLRQLPVPEMDRRRFGADRQRTSPSPPPAPHWLDSSATTSTSVSRGGTLRPNGVYQVASVPAADQFTITSAVSR